MEKQKLESKYHAAQQKIRDLKSALAHCVDCSAQIFDAVFNDESKGMAIVSLDGEVLLSNKVGAELLGYCQQSIIGFKFDFFGSPNSNNNYLAKAIGQGKSKTGFQVSIRHRDGRRLWLDVSANSYVYKDQNTLFILFSLIAPVENCGAEVPESSRVLELGSGAEARGLQPGQNVVQSESLFRAFFENRHTAILLIEPETGLIIDANQAAVEFYGYDAQELRRMAISQINGLAFSKIKELLASACAEERRYFEFKHRLASGELRDVEVYSGPVVIEGRNILVSVIHDISARKETEEQLRRCELVIASAPDFISLIDRNYVYRLVNDSYLRFFGKKREEIVGRHMCELLGPDVFNDVSKPNLDRAFSGSTEHAETQVELSGKGKVYFSLTYHPVKNHDGSIDFVALNARDVTEHIDNVKAMKLLSTRLSLATHAANIGIWEWDIPSGKVVWDEVMYELFQVDPNKAELTYDVWRSRVHPDDRSDAEAVLARSMDSDAPFNYEFRIILPDGQIRNIKASAVINKDIGNGRMTMVGVNQDVTERRMMEKKLLELATTDPLTGVYNRRQFMERAVEEFERFRRHSAPVSILYLDIDYFKKVNDSYGHHVGDEVLIDLALLCKSVLRTTDIFARMGGEEFAAVLVETGSTAAKDTAERLRKAVEMHQVAVGKREIKYTVSIGLSRVVESDTGIDEALIRADTALYAAKRLGRNRVEFV